MPRLALTMIVRDEAHVIERCLTSARPLIDSYVICDTGSSDDTVERIERALADLPGVIHHRPWVDFGYNRTELAALSAGVADHQLLLDADMTVELDGKLQPLDSGVAYLCRHRGEVDYLAPRFVDGSLPWRWVGSTHEHLDCAEPFRQELLDGVAIVHHGDGAADGGRRFVRDRALLERDLAADPDNPRTIFYLGLVLLGLGHLDRAREFLDRRVKSGAEPVDERFHAAVRCAEIDISLGDEATAAARRAIGVDPERAEGWLVLAWAWRARGRLGRARRAAQRARSCEPPPLASFVRPGASGWLADLELARCAHAGGRSSAAIAATARVLAAPDAPGQARTAAHDLGGPVGTARTRARSDRRRRVPRLATSAAWRIELDCIPRWRVTNPSITATADGPMIALKLTNAGSDGGRYRFDDRTNRFRTLGAVIDLDHELGVRGVRPVHDPATTIPPVSSHATGTEDLRPIEINGRTLAIGWAREFGRQGVLGPVMIDLRSQTAIRLPQPDPYRHEKNWMPFVRDGRLHVVVRIDPLTVYTVDDGGGMDLVSAAPPLGTAVAWRGGSQGVPVDDGWLFVVHERVPASGPMYEHRFVLVDRSLRLAKASNPFTITGAPVEFVAGLIRHDGRFLLSAGISDAHAVLVAVEDDTVFRALRAPRSGWTGWQRRRDLRKRPTAMSPWLPPPSRIPPPLDESENRPPPRRALPRMAITYRAALRRVDDLGPVVASNRHRSDVADLFGVDRKRRVTGVQALKFSAANDLRFPLKYAEADGWIRCRVDPRDLRNMYGRLGAFKAKKNERFGDMAARLPGDSAVDEPGFAAKVLVKRPAKAVLVLQSKSGNGYAFDGNHRALNACLHNEDWIEAIVLPADQGDWH